MRWILSIFLLQLAALSAAGSANEAPKIDLRTLLFDYPPLALREGWQGTVHYKLMVGKNGKAKSCKITQSSGHVFLDDETCKAMKKRVRFQPATDHLGKPTDGLYESKFTFRIPR
jgi:protein TonB